MRSIAILQARTNSSRLPGKVLLPVGGRPLVILAAQRAANTGRDIIIATSTESTDDALAELVVAAGIQCYRGSLNNTLQRIVDALDGFCDDTLVFRLTADNVIPDGSLLDEMEKEFLRRGLKYLCCNGERSGLPYGMSAELTRACYLREAANCTKSLYDQEHVTPYIRFKYGEIYFQNYKHLSKGNLRCTVDNLDDYLSIQAVFSGVQFPERVDAFELIDRLEKNSAQSMGPVVAKKLVLGTVQMGMIYGIVNQTGQLDQAISEKLIKCAISNGAKYLDTARAYGESETVIGNALKFGWEGRVQIITKLSPLLDCPKNADANIVNAFVDASIFRSCSSLRMQEIDVLMLHRAAHLWEWSGAVWKRLLDHKREGRLKALGVSVQTPRELELTIKNPLVDFIQMPFNVLDWRWDKSIPMIKEAKKERPLVIHARSALLQGLLLSEVHENWWKANVKNPGTVIEWLKTQCCNSDRVSISDFCLNFVNSTDWVDGVVVGVESSVQLAENIRALSDINLSYIQLENIVKNRPILDERTLNPAYWGT